MSVSPVDETLSSVLIAQSAADEVNLAAGRIDAADATESHSALADRTVQSASNVSVVVANHLENDVALNLSLKTTMQTALDVAAEASATEPELAYVSKDAEMSLKGTKAVIPLGSQVVGQSSDAETAEIQYAEEVSSEMKSTSVAEPVSCALTGSGQVELALVQTCHEQTGNTSKYEIYLVNTQQPACVASTRPVDAESVFAALQSYVSC